MAYASRSRIATLRLGSQCLVPHSVFVRFVCVNLFQGVSFFCPRYGTTGRIEIRGGGQYKAEMKVGRVHRLRCFVQLKKRMRNSKDVSQQLMRVFAEAAQPQSLIRPGASLPHPDLLALGSRMDRSCGLSLESWRWVRSPCRSASKLAQCVLSEPRKHSLARLLHAQDLLSTPHTLMEHAAPW